MVVKNVNYKLKFNGSNTGSSDDPINDPVNDPVKFTVNEQKIIDFIRVNPNMTRKEMAEEMGCSDSTVKRAIAGLVKKNVLERQGSDKTGSWIVHI